MTATDDVRIEITRFNAAQRRLCDDIPREGSTLPLEAGDRLMQAATALALNVQIQGAFGAGVRAVAGGRPDGGAAVAPEREHCGADR